MSKFAFINYIMVVMVVLENEGEAFLIPQSLKKLILVDTLSLECQALCTQFLPYMIVGLLHMHYSL